MNRLHPILLGAGLLAASVATAQTAARGSATAAEGRDVSAATSGSGTTTPTAVGVTGTADATAADGGTARSRADARFTDNRAMQRATASARDDDERARSRTMTTVRKGDEVRSRSFSIYKERGEKPVIERCRTRTTAQGTDTRGEGCE